MTGPHASEFTEPDYVATKQPAPEVGCIKVAVEDCPQGIRTIVNFVRKHGGEATVTYGRGYVPHATQDKFTLKHSLWIRIRTVADGPVTWGAFYWGNVTDEDHESPMEAKYTTGGCINWALPGVYNVTEMKKRIKEEADDDRQ